MSIEAADLIVHGGTIDTVDDAQPTVEAVAVAGGRIIAVGARDEHMAIMSALSPRAPDGQAHFLERGLDMAMSFGYTTVQEGRAFTATHDALVGLAQDGAFDIDVAAYLDYTCKGLLDGAWHRRDYRDRYRTNNRPPGLQAKEGLACA